MLRYQEPKIKDLKKRARVLRWLAFLRWPVSILLGFAGAWIHWEIEQSLLWGFVEGLAVGLVVFALARREIEGGCFCD